jgi:arsenate reductase
MKQGKKQVLFVCTHNSARSQMAEGILRELYGDRYEVYSAGVEPSHVSPYAVEVLKEKGINISDQRSKHINEFKEMEFDLVVTVCDHAREACPFYSGKQVVHQSFSDPAAADGSIEEIWSAFRTVRDEIWHWIQGYFGAKEQG